MKLSIVIVNYNVVFFLEQCLESVFSAIKNIEAEVLVVDNNSVDGSCAMIKKRYPQVVLTESKENLGFSKGNNLAIKQAKGTYILLLNPDTVVEEDTFEKSLQFMDKNPKIGGLGVKMVDGKGRFLPESKRGLPTPEIAFYKIFGLAALFPNSKKFGGYHLSYLDKDENHQVDVLSGAFMLMPKKVLNEIGLLDEAFFMYGEDIDLSYRIQQGGYENYYFSDTSIIHYKGESTKKSSVNYVFVFYNAMIIFAKKHFSKSNASTFTFVIKMAIYFRATIALFRRLVTALFLPLLDFIFILVGLFVVKHFYQEYTAILYKDFVHIGLIFYALTWCLTSFFTGSYDKPIKLQNAVKGVAFGGALILIFYSLLDESYRFSRAIILLGTAWTFVSTIGVRLALHLMGVREYQLANSTKKRIAIVGSPEEINRVEELYQKLNLTPEISVNVSPVWDLKYQETDGFYASLSQLNEAIVIFQLNEVVFCSKDTYNQDIIKTMSALSDVDVEFKIAPESQTYVIGSNSINATGELYNLVDISAISSFKNKRNRWIFNLLTSLIILIFYPILLFFVTKKGGLFFNVFKVLFGFKTWVGYHATAINPLLPKIKKGVVPCAITPHKGMLMAENEQNIYYAKNYNAKLDFDAIIKNWSRLGN